MQAEIKKSPISTPDVLVAEVCGRIDSTNAEPVFKFFSKDDNTKYKKIGLDFTQTEYMSNTGIFQLLSLRQRLQNMQGEVHIIPPVEPRVVYAFEIVGITAVFSTYNNPLALLRSFTSPHVQG